MASSIARHVLAASVISVIAVTACATNPATGKSQLSLISEGQEIAMGYQADTGVVVSMGLYDDAKFQSYIQQLGTKLAATSERTNLPWTFRVVDDPVVNAFAIPGGFVYVTRGIMAHLTSEAELASVVGHEIGHVTARHSVSQMSKAQLAQIGLVAGVLIGGEKVAPFAGLASQGMQLLFLKFSRDDESQADELGLRYIKRAQYDPHPMVEVFTLLDRISQTHGGGRVPEWQSTHPDPGNRAQHIQSLIASSTEPTGKEVGRNYVDMLDGLVYGDDPRQGFFRDNRFFHPTLKFQMEFPSGWKTANSRQSVAAMNPEQNAMLELTVANAAGAEEAAREFFGQKGITASQPQRGTIHQMPAVSGTFRAATEDGSTLDGIATFVRYGNSTYRLLGYGASAAWTRNGGAVERAISSFDRVTDPSVLNAQPLRINIVTIDRAMTLEQFNRQHPSDIPIEDLGLINQAEAGTQLPAGTRVKQVKK